VAAIAIGETDAIVVFIIHYNNNYMRLQEVGKECKCWATWWKTELSYTKVKREAQDRAGWKVKTS